MDQWEQWTKISMQAHEYLFRRVDENGYYMPHQAIYGFASFRVLQFCECYALLSRLDELSFESFLDVGCAEGFYPRLVQARYGAEVYGVDFSASAVRRMWEYHRIEGICGDAHNLPIKTDAFDLVLCNSTVEHTTEPMKVISELMRITRKHLFIGIPLALSRKEVEGFKPDFNAERDQHVHIFSHETLHHILPREHRVNIYYCRSLPVLILNAIYKRSLGRVGNFLPLVRWMLRLDLILSDRWPRRATHAFVHVNLTGEEIPHYYGKRPRSSLLNFILEDIYHINREELGAKPLHWGTEGCIPWREFRVKPTERPPTRTRVSDRVLAFLACPECKSDVVEDNGAILCSRCGAQYPVWDGIPLMHNIR
jgi:SAM-dependent methyltransferase